MSALREAAQQALEALEDHANQYPHMQKGYTVDAITALKAVLEQPEPVACPHRDEPRGCYRVRCQLGRKCVEPLYTHPPRREWRGLTDEEIRDLWSWSATSEAERTATTQQHAFARAIERAHGIGGDA